MGFPVPSFLYVSPIPSPLFSSPAPPLSYPFPLSPTVPHASLPNFSLAFPHTLITSYLFHTPYFHSLVPLLHLLHFPLYYPSYYPFPFPLCPLTHPCLKTSFTIEFISREILKSAPCKTCEKPT